MIAIVFALIAFNALSGGDENSTEAAPKVTAPDGYRFGGFGDDVAYRFLVRHDCDYYDHCTAVELYGMRDCTRGVYVEANLLDRSGRIIDWTNGTVSALPRHGKAVVILGWYDGKVKTTQLTQLNCNG